MKRTRVLSSTSSGGAGYGKAYSYKRPKISGVRRVARKGPPRRRHNAARIRGYMASYGLLGMERKFIDHANMAVGLTAPVDGSGGEQADPPNFLCLNGVGMGDAANERDGKSITMLSLQVEGNIITPADATNTAPADPPTYFVAIVLDRQTNGAQMNSEDCFSNPSGDGRLAANPLRNMKYSKRFKVLAMQRGIATPGGPATWYNTVSGNTPQNGTAWNFHFYIDLKGMKTEFETGTTSGYVTTIVDNSIHIIAYCTDIDLQPVISYNSRLRFYG